MNQTQDDISIIYNHLKNYNCLCAYSETSFKDFWNRIYHHKFNKEVVSEASDDQLLCISFTRLVAEICIDVSLKYQSVCCHIYQLFEVLSSEEMWSVFVNHLKCSKDKYLVYCFIKTFCEILSVSKETVVSKRIETLLNDVEDNFLEESSVPVLDFLSNLVQHKFEPSEVEYDITSCKNVLPSEVNLNTDLFQNLCTVLSRHWPSIMSQFHEVTSSKCEKRRIIPFLVMWQKIILRVPEEDLFNIFLNKAHVISFFSRAFNMDVISLRIYVDIIMQYFICNLKLASPQEDINSSVKETVQSVLKNDFFSLLPHDVQIYGFCISTSSSSDKNPYHFQKYDAVIVKKVAFIFLSLISGFGKEDILCDAVEKIFNFVKMNFDVPPDASGFCWIVDVLIDQDDLLFGTMLSMLRIYITLKKKCLSTPKYLDLQKSLNPHAVFIFFLQRIGYDHNELLSFLTSDETCFLLYILQYLKLLLQEWDVFVETHNSYTGNKEVLSHPSTSKTRKKLSKASHSPPSKRLLVSYSSSSSEEETSDIKEDSQLCQKTLPALDALINLKQAIKKLVEAGGFPYNVLPLLTLLQSCENLYSESFQVCLTDIKEESQLCQKTLSALNALMNLKQAIKKLVEAGGFPYNVLPLLTLLQSCENLYSESSRV